MAKWKAISIEQALLDQVKKEVKKDEYTALSEFVAEAIQLRLQSLAKQRVAKYLERDKVGAPPPSRSLATNVWTRLSPEGPIEVGVTELFQRRLQEIVNIRTEVVGGYISAGAPFGAAESWWFTFDLNAPVSGKIVDVNQAVLDDPFTLNADTSQWIIKIQPAV